MLILQTNGTMQKLAYVGARNSNNLYLDPDATASKNKAAELLIVRVIIVGAILLLVTK